MRIAGDSFFCAESFSKSLTENNSDVFYGMVLINFKIALTPHRKIKQTMTCKSIQHMVQKSDTRLSIRLSPPLQRNSSIDGRFTRFSGSLLFTHHPHPC